MTVNRPQPPRHSNRSSSSSEIAPKPYAFVSFPTQRPNLQHPAGHDKYKSDRIHGTLFLTLHVQTALHVSTGVVAMGSDIGNNRISLIKTMVQGIDNKLSIQGSSLKGCIRSVYEAITNSTLAVITNKYRDKIPPCRKKEELCPASQVFGALDWQGLIQFSDATCESTGFSTGFMPSLYAPRTERTAYYTKGKVAGRKFYYHTIRAIDKGQDRGIPVQQAAKEYTFTTQLQFKNLQPAELGTLFIVLGQDPNYPIALKVGGGKPIGMGSMTVTINQINAFTDSQELAKELKLPKFCDRYSSYHPSESDSLTGKSLTEFIPKMVKSAHAKLIQKPQLEELTQVLRYPTHREPPSGMY